jgi:hypothetical protein
MDVKLVCQTVGVAYLTIFPKPDSPFLIAVSLSPEYDPANTHLGPLWKGVANPPGAENHVRGSTSHQLSRVRSPHGPRLPHADAVWETEEVQEAVQPSVATIQNFLIKIPILS